jgi:hypothetical protein
MIDFLKYRTGLKSLDNFLKNLEYVEKSSNNFEEEMEFIEKITQETILKNKSELIKNFFWKLGEIRNETFFDSLIMMIYLLQKKLKKEEEIINLQNIFFETIKSKFITQKEFSPKLNLTGVYLKDFTSPFKNINEQKKLILNTLRILYELSKELISRELEPKIKKTYLESMLAELNQFYEHLNFEQSSKERGLNDEGINTKENFQLSLEKDIALKKIELFYLILYKIDKNELEKDFFDISLKIYQSGELEKGEYFKLNYNYNNLDWLNYDTFRGGVQTIPPFNQTKYRILISFYKYLQQNKKIDIKNFEKENFSDYVHPSFKSEIETIDYAFLNKYFSFEDKEWVSFKKEFNKQLNEKIKEIKEQSENYEINTKIKEEYRKKFISDCSSSWNVNQNKIESYTPIKYKKGGKEIKENFGQYTLCDKIWFIDSFDKGTDYDRTLGNNFARDQNIGKEKVIITKIIESFNSKKDKEVEVTTLIDFLNKEIKEGEYILFYGKDSWGSIYSIKEINWNSEFGERASLIVNGAKIFFYYTNYFDSCLLYKKGDFNLIQYEQGFEDKNIPLYVSVDELISEDIKKIIESPDSKIKSELELKKKVKIRISEKFNIERNNSEVIYKIKIKKKNETNTSK